MQDIPDLRKRADEKPVSLGGAANNTADNRSGLSKALSFYSAYGWRGRIGLIAPSTNTSLEPEFSRMAPDGVAVHVSRVHQEGVQGDLASYRRMADGIATASMLLATAEIDVVAFGCTSCTYYVPADEIRATMTKHTGRPAVLPAEAVVAALRHLGVSRVAVVGPRTELVTSREVEFLGAENFEVVSSACLGLGATEEERRGIGRVPPQVLHRLAVAADRPEAQAIFVSCTQFPTLAMIQPLEALLGKPVVASNQATFWRCLEFIGCTEPIAGFGALLSRK
jgi:arylmalonate decarboxylase